MVVGANKFRSLLYEMEEINQMADEPNVNNEPAQEDNAANYIAAIAELKANTVSKEKYEQLKQENTTLLNAIMNGDEIAAAAQEEPVDKQKLREELYNIDNELSPYDYISKTMKLREAIMEEGGEDPFLPVGKGVIVTNEDREAAQRVASAFEHCLEYSEGDPEVFSNELMRLTNDNMPRTAVKAKNTRR